MANTLFSAKASGENASYNEDLLVYLFQAFTPIALAFLVVYAVLQANAGLMSLALLYGVAAVVVAVNYWAIRLHHRLVIAANIFAFLGPLVLLPWQATGGIGDTGLMWFPAYIIFVMLFVPGKGGSFWVIFTYTCSFFLLLLQLQGLVPLPFRLDVMSHFYFVGSVTFTIVFLFLKAQRVIMDVFQLQIGSLKKSAEIAKVGAWAWNIADNSVELSDQFYRLFGFDVHERITRESYLLIVHPEDRQVVEQTVKEALQDHQPYSLIHRVISPNEEVIWVHSLGEVACDAAGKPVRMMGTVQDITERMKHGSTLLPARHHTHTDASRGEKIAGHAL